MICPHCGKEFNAGKVMGATRTAKKQAAAKERGKSLARQWANARKLEKQVFAPPPDPQVQIAADQCIAISTNLKPSDGLVMPKGSMKLDDLKQLLKSGGRIGGSSHLAPGLLDSAGNPNLPCAPFDINLEGEPHRVVRMGSKLALQYIGGGEPVFTRHLQPGELEKFWEARIK